MSCQTPAARSLHELRHSFVGLDTMATISILTRPHFHNDPAQHTAVNVTGIAAGATARTEGTGTASMAFSLASGREMRLGLPGAHCMNGPRNIIGWSHIFRVIPGIRLTSSDDGSLQLHFPGEPEPVVFSQAERPGLYMARATHVGLFSHTGARSGWVQSDLDHKIKVFR